MSPGAPPRRPVDALPESGLGQAEFVSLVACMMAMPALSIDIVLPALPRIAHQLGVKRANDQQHVVSAVILGMSIGQVFYGPLSDSVGRKPTIYLSLAVFGIGCVTALFATQFWVMLTARFLQGLGAAGARIVTVALVRDQYAGPAMARVMSVVISALMVGPLLAPFLGQGLLWVAHWRIVFAALLVLDLALFAWFAARQPETLPKSRRQRFSWAFFASSVREICASRAAIGYTLAAGIAFGELFAYVNSAPQVFLDLYEVGVWFPLYFATSGVSIATACAVNARLVLRRGMRWLCIRAAIGKAALSALFLLVAWIEDGRPPLWATLILLGAVFFCVGILFANLNAMAMEPLGHVAGIAAGVLGSLTWFLAVILATLIGRRFDGSILPLVSGFVVLSFALVGVLHQMESTDGNLVRHS
jgi:MFS transporter, DHA1 family, multidrug resistance protein